uniref:Uncharacterized protein n=1 Tax=Heterorhabditis bacteriophora TaxID=37862 RepID=A0A1I7XED8_HETBA
MFNLMQRCQTLPRPGPSEAPPPPPHRRGGTLTRKNKDLDINRLINEIDMRATALSSIISYEGGVGV